MVTPARPYVTVPGCGVRIYVQVMRTPAERRAGLRGRASMPTDCGALFVHENDDFWPYTMEGCLFPLDLLWLDRRGRVLDWYVGASPCQHFPCSDYRPIFRARYVLELLGGVSPVLAIGPGTLIDLRGALL